MHDIENMDLEPTAKFDKHLWDYFKKLKTPFKVYYPSESNGWAVVRTQDEIHDICTCFHEGYIKAVRIVRCLNALKDIPQPEYYMDALKSKISILEEQNNKTKEELEKTVIELLKTKKSMNELEKEYNDLKEEKENIKLTLDQMTIEKEKLEEKYKYVPKFILNICNFIFG